MANTPELELVSKMGPQFREELRKIVAIDVPENNSKAPLTILNKMSDTDLTRLFIRLVTRGNKPSVVAIWAKRHTNANLKQIRLKLLVDALKLFVVAATPVLPRLQALAGKYGAKGLTKQIEKLTEEAQEASQTVNSLQRMYVNLPKIERRMIHLMKVEEITGFKVSRAGPTQAAITDFMQHCKDILTLEMKMGVREQRPTELDINVTQTFQHYNNRIQQIAPPASMVESTRSLIGFLKSQEDGFADAIDCTEVVDADLVAGN